MKILDCKESYLEVTAPQYPGHIGKCLWAPYGGRWRILERLEPGDCILHYITRRRKGREKVFVGVSVVAKKYKVVDREELIELLRKLGIWNEDYMEFSSRWLNRYERFYFIELRDFTEFRHFVSLREVRNIFNPQKYQRYVSKVDKDLFIKIVKLGMGEESISMGSGQQRIRIAGIVKGNVVNVAKSLLDALSKKDHVFLWGFRGLGD